MKVGALDRTATRGVAEQLAVAAVGVGTVVIALTLGAYARVYLPFTPVPVTLQTLVVLIAGAALGPSLGTAAVGLYLALGAAGLPLFTSVWRGHTTGYLIGFVVAAWMVGVLTHRVPSPSTRRLVLAMSAGLIAIFFCGVTYLGLYLQVSPSKALALGLFPFVPGGIAKLGFAAAFCRAGRHRLRMLFP